MRGVREAKGSGCHHQKSPKEGKFRLDIRFFIFFFFSKSNEALAQVAQRCSGCPVPGDTQGQAGQGSENLIEL